jgi:hypothetical protein
MLVMIRWDAEVLPLGTFAGRVTPGGQLCSARGHGSSWCVVLYVYCRVSSASLVSLEPPGRPETDAALLRSILRLRIWGSVMVTAWLCYTRLAFFFSLSPSLSTYLWIIRSFSSNVCMYVRTTVRDWTLSDKGDEKWLLGRCMQSWCPMAIIKDVSANQSRILKGLQVATITSHSVT